jgi:ribonuclease HI
VAEYGELIEALRWATSEGLRGVEIYSDSQLMAEVEATLSWVPAT